MLNNIYIAFNYNLTNHDWSISSYNELSGKIKCIQLERLDRIKHSPSFLDLNLENYFSNGFNYIIEGLNKEDYNFYIINPPYSFDFLNNVKIFYSNDHHYNHASLSFFSSGFSEGIILVGDASGYDFGIGLKNFTVWQGNGDKIQLIHSIGEQGKYGMGIGYLLHSIFLNMNEGSLMGLSSYGDYSKFDHLNIFKYENGQIFLDDIFSLDISRYSLSDIEEVFSLSKKFDLSNNNKLLHDILEKFELVYGVKSLIGNKINDLPNSIYADIAAKIQNELEKGYIYILNYLKNTKGINFSNLCIGGGIGLNSVLNGLLSDIGYFKNIYVPSAPDDSGLSLGVLLDFLVKRGISVNSISNITSFGLHYSDYIILTSLNKYLDSGIEFKYYDDIELSKIIKNDLIKGNILAIFNKGSEFGHRALLNRSIIGNPSILGIKDRINIIKGRAFWRPLGLVFSELKIKNYIKNPISSNYMNFVGYVLDDKLNYLSSGVHVDGTTRYQTINDKINPLFNSILVSGDLDSIINTSLNVSDEPIVETPEEAIVVFLTTDIDKLILGNYICEKKNKISRVNLISEKKNHIYKDNNYVKYGLLLGKIISSIFKVDFRLIDTDMISIELTSKINNIDIKFSFFPKDIYIENNFYNFNNFNILVHLSKDDKNINESIPKIFYNIDRIYGKDIFKILNKGLFFKRIGKLF